MKRHIYASNGIDLLRTVDAEPVHGEDYCDECGDCLDCNSGDPCVVGSDDQHFWVEYIDD